MPAESPGRPGRLNLRDTLVTLVVVALAATLAWRGEDRARETAFQAPGLVEVVHEEEGGVARDLSQVDGRLRAQARLALVLRWLVDPVELAVREPQGWVELALGDAGGPSAALQLSPDAARLHVHQADGTIKGWRVDRPEGSAFSLTYDGSAYEVRAGETLVEQAVPGPPPAGPARVGLRPQASLRSVRCRTAAGEERLIAGPQPGSAAGRAAWAGITALLGLWASREWWRARWGRPAGGERATGNGRAAWLLAGLVAVLLVHGLAASLREHNESRFLVAPEPCAQEPLEREGVARVQPGRPLELPGRLDGDFELSARVRLDPRSVIDVLVRGEPAERDRGVLVTLSTDPSMPVGITANLGTSLETVHAGGARALLAAERELDLRIVCRDADTRLFVDGEELVEARNHDLRAGRTAFLALSGSATVSGLVLRPTGQPRMLDGALLRWQWSVGAVVVAALGLMLALSGRRVCAVLWAWPMAAAVAPAAPDALVVPGAVGAGLLLLFTPLGGPLRRVLGWLAGAVAMTVFAWAATEQPVELTPTLLNDMRPADVWGEPVPRTFAWARHPLVRRFNHYVRGQRFRGEAASLAPTPGVTRVFTLGSSSTFGYGVAAEAAYPEQLEQQLREAGHPVEVFNAGIPGSTAARLALNLEGQLLPYAPDVVIVNLSFNDHIQGAIYDEHAHYEAMTTTGIGLPGHLLALWDGWRRTRSWARYFSAAREGGQVDPSLLETHALAPSRRFGDELRRMILAARARGAEVVLVQEPPDPAADNPMIEPFHRAMAEAAAETGALLVDPTPALQPGGSELYLDAVHLTAEGHRRMAGVLARALSEAGLVD